MGHFNQGTLSERIIKRIWEKYFNIFLFFSNEPKNNDHLSTQITHVFSHQRLLAPP